MKRKNLLIGLSVLIFSISLGWLFMQSVSPDESSLPGEKITDLGRTHVNDISDVAYNSNPSTSGNHFPIWAKRGLYDRVISDGYLIHSLEHGYVVLSYNCDFKPQSFLIKEAFAHEGEPVEIHNIATDSAEQSSRTSSTKPLMQMRVQLTGGTSAFTPENAPDKEVELSEQFNSDSCKQLVSQLGETLNEAQRIIIVPRPGMDTKIALTAWNRIEKMNEFDKEKINTFIKVYHNKGPEKTME